MTQCKEWGVPEGFFQGLCSKLYEPLQGTDECPVCVTPYNVITDCTPCGNLKARYIYSLILGNKLPYCYPNIGICVDSSTNVYHNNTFPLVYTGGCQWDSEVDELYCTGATRQGSTDYIQTSTATNARKRFTLNLSSNPTQTLIYWQLVIRWQSILPIAQQPSVRQRTDTYRAQSQDCHTLPTKWALISSCQNVSATSLTYSHPNPWGFEYNYSALCPSGINPFGTDISPFITLN